jgi:hypothetical protein
MNSYAFCTNPRIVELPEISGRLIRGFLLLISFHLGSLYSYTPWGMKKRPIGGCGLETWTT